MVPKNQFFFVYRVFTVVLVYFRLFSVYFSYDPKNYKNISKTDMNQPNKNV